MRSSGQLDLKADGLCHPNYLVFTPLTNVFMLRLSDQLKQVVRILCPPYNDQFVSIQTRRNKYLRTWEGFSLDKALINCCIHMDRLWERNALSQEELDLKGRETDFNYVILPTYLQHGS